MKRKKISKLTLISLLLNLALSAQPMEKITFYDLKASDKAESIDYYFQENFFNTTGNKYGNGS